MGYYTRYTGYVTGPAPMLNDFTRDGENGKTFGKHELLIMDWFDDFFGGGGAKWYDWEDDVKAISQEYPHLLFSLEGEGEESGDIWKAWARNGKVVKVQAKIVFEEPDLNAELPAPSLEEALARRKAARRAEIDAQIAKLKAQRDAL